MSLDQLEGNEKIRDLKKQVKTLKVVAYWAVAVAITANVAQWSIGGPRLVKASSITLGYGDRGDPMGTIYPGDIDLHGDEGRFIWMSAVQPSIRIGDIKGHRFLIYTKEGKLFVSKWDDQGHEETKKLL